MSAPSLSNQQILQDLESVTKRALYLFENNLSKQENFFRFEGHARVESLNQLAQDLRAAQEAITQIRQANRKLAQECSEILQKQNEPLRENEPIAENDELGLL
eukprot:TRINITY_DN5034_c0_g1_i20.p1 TRINITY_DN5034_c0_g1~~TRINITY_DN5034_c0_g1_i20.p1  ORF type:complete len:103 (-),score=16.52 TRINITY_DN5034_c0_g1_i20:187-495(-)